MNTDTIHGWQKWHCRVGKINPTIILTWARNAAAARLQVAEFEQVPLHWVDVQPMGIR